MAKNRLEQRRTERFDIGQESKKAKVSAFLAPIAKSGEAIDLLFGLIAIRTKGGAQKGLDELRQKHGVEAFDKMQRQLYSLVSECRSDYDEIEVMLKEEWRVATSVDLPFVRPRPEGAKITMPKLWGPTAEPAEASRAGVTASLSGELPTSTHQGAPFVKPRAEDNGEEEEPSPWELKLGGKILDEVTPVIDQYEGARDLFTAVVCTVNPEDETEVKAMIEAYAPNSTPEQFKRMRQVLDRVVTRFSRIMKRSPSAIRRIIRLKLDNAKVLPEGLPGMTKEEAQRAPTMLSSENQKKILARLKHRIRRKKSS